MDTPRGKVIDLTAINPAPNVRQSEERTQAQKKPSQEALNATTENLEQLVRGLCGGERLHSPCVIKSRQRAGVFLLHAWLVNERELLFCLAGFLFLSGNSILP
jgi:hypothetical protein